MRAKRLFLFIALFSVLSFCITCKKEYSYEGGPLAAYSFKGTPGECAEYVLSGNYYKGAPLDSSDNVKVIADVKQAGSYVITTNTVDGISFSSSGVFTDT